MSYCRFQYQNGARYGLIENVRGDATITRTLADSPVIRSLISRARNKAEIALSAVRLLAPAEPSKIVCIGRNYREHAKELNHPIPTEPLFFLKPPSSVIATGDHIRRPNALSQRVDHEGELGVVIGKRCYRLRERDDVWPYILGYTCINDVTARDLQEKDGQWTRAKGFDTFCPVGPGCCRAPRSVEGSRECKPASTASCGKMGPRWTFFSPSTCSSDLFRR